MTKQDQQDLKNLVKEGTLDALQSPQGRNAISEALTTEKARDAVLDVFVEAFHEVVVPVFEDQNKRIKRLEKTMGVGA